MKDNLNLLTEELIEEGLMADGVEFPVPRYLQVGSKIDCFDVVKVRIIKKSVSGKTCDVELVKKSKIYDSSKREYTNEVRVTTMNYDRVKTWELIFKVKHIVEATSNLSR